MLLLTLLLQLLYVYSHCKKWMNEWMLLNCNKVGSVLSSFHQAKAVNIQMSSFELWFSWYFNLRDLSFYFLLVIFSHTCALSYGIVMATIEYIFNIQQIFFCFLVTYFDGWTTDVHCSQRMNPNNVGALLSMHEQVTIFTYLVIYLIIYKMRRLTWYFIQMSVVSRWCTLMDLVILWYFPMCQHDIWDRYLWFWVKYLCDYGMNCHEMWYIHSFFYQDEL